MPNGNETKKLRQYNAKKCTSQITDYKEIVKKTAIITGDNKYGIYASNIYKVLFLLYAIDFEIIKLKKLQV
jgi:hypothetical protein